MDKWEELEKILIDNDLKDISDKIQQQNDWSRNIRNIIDETLERYEGRS